ncbi:hypothetical protein HNQ36_005122 [Afipia massiliensis]|uniref:DUF6894 domain-containing protein n=1 Tax=Afipia massiliensis TaxID=211460 RepID=A0A840NBT7_9BRAD|nr:hypothetical protein [Afipia massiliensis]MBB5055111.1 hypothetical protein [Afipia massiliensis]
MPRYYFNIFHGSDAHWDHEGEELPDRDAAWEEATKVAGETIKDLDGKLALGRPWRLEVTDEFANPLW